MRRKFNYIIVIIISFLFCSANVSAANSYEITGPSSVASGTSYTVRVNYSGSDKIGSFSMQVTIVNSECSIASKHSDLLINCTGGFCQSSLTSTNGISSGTNLVTFSCKSPTPGTATFKAATVGNDSWNVDGDTMIKISNGNKSITVTGTTTARTVSTTKSTAPPRTTTARTSTTKKTTTTTKKTTTTTKKITSIVNNTTTTTTTRRYTTTTSMLIPPAFTYTTTTPIIITSSSDIAMTTESTTNDNVIVVPDTVVIQNLKVVGYDIDFNPNRINYTIEVDEDVKELYIIAENNNDNIKVENTGVVNIEGEKEVVVKVFSMDSQEEIAYRLNIKIKKNDETSFKAFLVSIGIILLLIIILKVWQEIKKIGSGTKYVEEEAKPVKTKVKKVAKKEEKKKPHEVKKIEKEEEPIEYFEKLDNVEENISSSKPILNSKISPMTDQEKQKLDEEDELWLAVETKTEQDDVLVEVSEVVPNKEEDLDELFNNIDDYLEK